MIYFGLGMSGQAADVLRTGMGLAVSYHTPGLHNEIPAHKIFARVWVAQKSFFS